MQTVDTTTESAREFADAAYRLAHVYFRRAQQSDSVASREYWLGAAGAQQTLATRADEKARHIATASL